VLGLTIGFLYFQLGQSNQDALLRPSLIFFMVIFTLLNSMPSVPKIILERSVFYRERASMSYRTIIYLSSIILEDLPFMILTVGTFLVPVYWLGGLQREPAKFFFFVFAFLCVYLVAFGYVQLIAIITPSIGAANALLGTSLPVMLLFAGFLISKNNIPDYWIWAHYLSFLSYIIEALLVNELNDLTFHCRPSEFVQVPINGTGLFKDYCRYTSGQDILEQFDLEEHMMWWDVLILVGFYIFFVTLCVLGLKFIKNIKR